MEDFTEKILEKKINFWIRNILRFMCWVILLFYMIFRIIKPIINDNRIILDKNDGYLISGCLAMLLVIESVRAVFRTRLKDLENKIDDKLEKEE